MVEWDLWFIGSGVSLKIPRESGGDFAGINYSPVKHRSARHGYGVCDCCACWCQSVCGPPSVLPYCPFRPSLLSFLSFLTVLLYCPFRPSLLSFLSVSSVCWPTHLITSPRVLCVLVCLLFQYLPACMSVLLSAWPSIYLHACLFVCMLVHLPACMSVCSSVCLSICLPACLFVRLYACPSTCLHVSLFACMLVHLPAFMSLCSSVCLSIYLPSCLFVRLYACPSTCLPAFMSVCQSVCLSVCLLVRQFRRPLACMWYSTKTVEITWVVSLRSVCESADHDVYRTSSATVLPIWYPSLSSAVTSTASGLHCLA